MKYIMILCIVNMDIDDDDYNEPEVPSIDKGPGVFLDSVEPGVLVIVRKDKSTFPYRLTFDSVLGKMKTAFSLPWKDLPPLVFEFFYERDGRRYYISNDSDL